MTVVDSSFDTSFDIAKMKDIKHIKDREIGASKIMTDNKQKEDIPEKGDNSDTEENII